jgi:hypothetical protein
MILPSAWPRRRGGCGAGADQPGGDGVHEVAVQPQGVGVPGAGRVLLAVGTSSYAPVPRAPRPHAKPRAISAEIA